MLLSSHFALPYVDPYGYEIVAPQDVQLLAERVDAIMGGFDARTNAVLKRPTLLKGLTTPDSGWDDEEWGVFFDKTVFDNTGGALVSEGQQWRIVPGKGLSEDAWVLAGWYGQIQPVGAGTVGAYVDLYLSVVDPAQNDDVVIERWRARSYYTSTAEENKVCVPLRLKPGWKVRYTWKHSNTASDMQINTASQAWMTYLMAVE